MVNESNEPIYSFENNNQNNLNELKKIHRKIIFIFKFIIPGFIVLLVPSLIILFSGFIYLIYIWMITFFLLFLIGQYLDYKQSKLTYKCWYPEKIFQSDTNALLYIAVAFDIAIIISIIYFYLFFKFLLINSIQFIMFIIMINALLPITVYAKKRFFKNINSEAKHFKLEFDKLENIVEKLIKDDKIKYQTIKNKSIWKPRLVIFKLENSLNIEVFQGKGNGIRFKPLKAIYRKQIDRIQMSLDKYIQFMD